SRGNRPAAPLRRGQFPQSSLARESFVRAVSRKPPLQGAAESSAACGGESETEQVWRSQSTSVLQRAPCDAGTANRTVAAPQGADGGVHCRFAPQVSCNPWQGLVLCFVGDDACIVPETLRCRKP